MIDNSFNKKSFFKKKEIYIIAAICILAAGAGVFIAMNYNEPQVKDDSPTLEPTTLDLRIEYSEAATQANRPVKNEPDTRDTHSKEQATAKNAPNKPYSGSFALPMGTDISKDYSYGKLRLNKTTDDWRTHEGVDFGGSEGNNVIAIQDGKIRDVYFDPLWGNVIVVDHGFGIIAKYCGMDEKSLPQKGESVKKFQVIGKLGIVPIEKDDGSHLHFEIILNGKNEDPLKVMNKLGK